MFSIATSSHPTSRVRKRSDFISIDSFRRPTSSAFTASTVRKTRCLCGSEKQIHGSICSLVLPDHHARNVRSKHYSCREGCFLQQRRATGGIGVFSRRLLPRAARRGAFAREPATTQEGVHPLLREVMLELSSLLVSSQPLHLNPWEVDT